MKISKIYHRILVKYLFCVLNSNCIKILLLNWIKVRTYFLLLYFYTKLLLEL